MAIVCACLTTMRPLFAGINLSLLSSISWTGRTTASSSSTKSKGRCSDLIDDQGNRQEKEKRRTRLVFEHGESDIQFLAYRHEAEDRSKGGTIVFVERTTGREDTQLEDDTSSPLTIERGGSYECSCI